MPPTAAATDQRSVQTQTTKEEVVSGPRAQRQRAQHQHQRPLQPSTSSGPELHQRHRVHLEPGLHLSASGSAVGLQHALPAALQRLPHDLHPGPGLRPELRLLLVILHRAGLQLVSVPNAPAAVGHRGRSQPDGRSARPVARLALVAGLHRRVAGLRRRRLLRLQRPNGVLEAQLQRCGLSGLQGPELLEVPGPVERLEEASLRFWMVPKGQRCHKWTIFGSKKSLNE